MLSRFWNWAYRRAAIHAAYAAEAEGASSAPEPERPTPRAAGHQGPPGGVAVLERDDLAPRAEEPRYVQLGHEIAARMASCQGSGNIGKLTELQVIDAPIVFDMREKLIAYEGVESPASRDLQRIVVLLSRAMEALGNIHLLWSIAKEAPNMDAATDYFEAWQPDPPPISTDYLPLSGGTISGYLTVQRDLRCRAPDPNDVSSHVVTTSWIYDRRLLPPDPAVENRGSFFAALDADMPLPDPNTWYVPPFNVWSSHNFGGTFDNTLKRWTPPANKAFTVDIQLGYLPPSAGGGKLTLALRANGNVAFVVESSILAPYLFPTRLVATLTGNGVSWFDVAVMHDVSAPSPPILQGTTGGAHCWFGAR